MTKNPHSTRLFLSWNICDDIVTDVFYMSFVELFVCRYIEDLNIFSKIISSGSNKAICNDISYNIMVISKWIHQFNVLRSEHKILPSIWKLLLKLEIFNPIHLFLFCFWIKCHCVPAYAFQLSKSKNVRVNPLWCR